MVPHTKKGDERHGNSLILGTGAPPPNNLLISQVCQNILPDGGTCVSETSVCARMTCPSRVRAVFPVKDVKAPNGVTPKRDRLEEFEGNTKTRSRTLEVPEKKTSGESSTKRQYGRYPGQLGVWWWYLTQLSRPTEMSVRTFKKMKVVGA
ncbi:hypothetical protein RUM44_013730 [Polyplax serrata]|uniref:Uncharacterized protein n=1 Tax=Polyplax serrata TaxID=468196 RepID=A0ABR1BFA6_POLSC